MRDLTTHSQVPSIHPFFAGEFYAQSGQVQGIRVPKSSNFWKHEWGYSGRLGDHFMDCRYHGSPVPLRKSRNLERSPPGRNWAHALALWKTLASTLGSPKRRL